MANEYLQRTPTSTGNRKKFTWAGWIKRNDIDASGGNGYQGIFAVGTVDGAEDTFMFSSDQIRLRCESGSDVTTSEKYRDSGNWMHVMMVVDTTLYDPDHRCIFYVNGVKSNVMSQESDITQNADLRINSADKHYIGEFPRIDNHLDGQIYDVFLVDGQALTPDVFGFYKDGDGYQSSGSSRATDFRPGQWMPHAPSKIKKDINRRGGFGVNGFYLPMNDSSNPGADFHMTPNSIITLKGEDLPQPLNGAPTTSDSYVSQLRSDPFAANIVLAVPGILDETNNLITNGSFDSNTSGWSVIGGASVTVNSGQAQLTNNGTTNSSLDQAITTVVGHNYLVTALITPQGGGPYPRLYAAGSYGQVASNANVQQLVSVVRTATSTSTTISINANTNVNNAVTLIDDVKVFDLTPVDYSADIKGSGTNKTLTPYDTAGVGQELGGYYGSAMNFEGTGDDDYFDTGYSIDGTFGSGDYTIECWIHSLDDQSERGIFGMFGSQYGIAMRQFGSYNAGGNQTLQAFFGQSAAGYRCGTTVRIQDQWNHVAMVKEGTKGTLYLNGVAVGIADNVSSTPYSTSNLLIGIYYNGQYPYKGYIQDFRVYTTAKYKGGFDVPKPYTPVGIEAFRSVADTCKNNFATLNPLIGAGTASGDTVPALKDGNLFLDNANQTQTQSSIGMSSGKWYCEYRLTSSSVAAGGYYGVVGDLYADRNNQNSVQSAGWSHIRPGTGSNSYTKNWTATSLTTENPALGFVSGDIFGFALDLDSSPKNIKYFRNGTLLHTDSTIGDSGHYYFLAMRTNDGASGANWPDVYANFGQNPSFSGTVTAGTNADDSGKGLFKYTPPSGYLALCEDNLPTPAIADPGDHFKTVLYTGTNTNRSITGVGFKPGFVWTKERDGNEVPAFYDEVREPPNVLYSSETNSEENNAAYLYSFDDDGFTVGTGDLSNNDGGEFVAWCWKAGGATVSNTDGTLTSQVSANQTAGFSIVKFTAQTSGTGTVGHGLGKKPAFWIYKPLTTTTGWYTYHQSLGASGWLQFDTAAATTGNAAAWGGVEPTSTVLTHGSGLINQGSCILYAWAEIEGYSKFGSFEGNGSSDGSFVYLGFKPALVIVKQIDNVYTTGGVAGTSWGMWDSSRMPNNPGGNPLWANNRYSETTRGNGSSANTGGTDGNGLGGFLYVDMLSNGFKCRTGAGEINAAGTHIYMAWAESPFKTANAK